MLTPERLRTALDAAGIGHTIVRSLGHPDRWVTSCTVSVEDFARVVEKLVRADDAKVIIQLVEALENTSDLVFKDTRLSHTRNQALQKGWAWLAEQPEVFTCRTLVGEMQSEDDHAPQA